MPHGPHYKIRVIACTSGGRVGPPSSTRCVAHIINPVIIHEWEKKDGVVTTTNRTFPGHQWHSQPSHGGDNKTITPTNRPSLILIVLAELLKHVLHVYNWIELTFPLKTTMVINMCFSVIYFFICDLFYFLVFFQ